MATAAKAGPSAAAKKMFEIATTGRKLPGRYVIYGCEKVGKTSLAAFLPNPIFLQMKGETGLETLLDAGQLPPTAHLPGEVESWSDLLAAIDFLRGSEHDYKTLIIDGIDSAQTLCFEHVRTLAFDGDESKFMAYHKGYAMSPNTWKELLVAIDRLRTEQKMAVVFVLHARINQKKNPAGEDWTCYAPNLHERIWEPTAAWADAILFIDFVTIVKDGKGTDLKARVIYTEHDATHIAGNRYGLHGEIECGESGQEACKNLAAALKAARNTNKKEE